MSSCESVNLAAALTVVYRGLKCCGAGVVE